MSRRKVYQHVGGLHPRRSVMDISYSKLFDCDMGELIPVFIKECIPGDHFSISMEAVVRFHPLIAPVLHEIFMRTFYFFCPSRLIYDPMHKQSDTHNVVYDFDWESFITGGQEGDDEQSLPLWLQDNGTVAAAGSVLPKYSLWDYYGLDRTVPHASAYPIDAYKRCYNLVWNEYFRDQNLMDEVGIQQNNILRICWRKDRFTSALYDTQRGDRPAIPLSGLTSVSFNGPILTRGSNPPSGIIRPLGMYDNDLQGVSALSSLRSNQFYQEPSTWNESILDNTARASSTQSPTFRAVPANEAPVVNPAESFVRWLNNNSLNLSQAVTFDVIHMRHIFQYQKYLERNMRSGARYTEVLRARYGVRPEDARLNRPEYIGGTRSPVIVSEVLQTSQTTTGSNVLGQMGGHGITAEASRIGKYNVKEHGYIIGIMCIMPSALYMTGIPRECLRRTRYDFPTPELVNLSEVAIYNVEVCSTGQPRDGEIHGYQGIYDEMRVSESQVVGDMRDTLKFWHLGRDDFNAANPPSLNENFVRCQPTKRIFAVENVKGLMVHYGNRVRAVRPIPIIAEPGLIDHH